MPENAAIAVLITVPLSHYCEKARWALDRVKLPYREEPHAPLLHRLATKRNGAGSVPVLVHGSGPSLAAPVLFPVECRAVLPPLEAAPSVMQEEVLRFRNTAAGRYVLRLFSQERGCL